MTESFFFFQAEDGIRDGHVTGVQTCALPISNSLYLTDQLNQLGVDVIFKSVVGDSLRRMIAAAQHALFRSEIVIFSGGLGPTEDDLTREAVAEALGLGLQRDGEILKSLEQRF